MKAITPLRHITRPVGARDCLAQHHALDISAWEMSYGKEVLAMKGKVIEPDGQRPRDAVFAYRRGRIQTTAALIKCLFRIDLLPK